MTRTTILKIGIALAGSCPLAYGQSTPAPRIFTYKHAEQARRLAQEECKPLVLHFIPDDPVGDQQFDSFYQRPDAVPAAILDRVVIIAVPTRKFMGLARKLGITGPGGFRTISAYDMGPIDEKSQPTCRSGFV